MRVHKGLGGRSDQESGEQPKAGCIGVGPAHHRRMDAYSEDLRKKIVEAKERGMPTAEVARVFGVGLSSVKRYAKTAREGGSLSPKRSPGTRPKADERATSS